MDRNINQSKDQTKSKILEVFINIPPMGGKEYEPLFLSRISRLPQRIRRVHYQGRVKKFLDFSASLVGLVLLSPILIVIAFLIKITSRGPIIFSQQRVGKGGKIFRIYKFRTMYRDAEQKKAELMQKNEFKGPAFKMKNDPRITPLGRFLRRYSIDELPQLVNVVLGDMSLVGPRPALISETRQWDPSYFQRLSVEQGLTCIWQISGRSDLSFKEWMEMDLEYVKSWNFFLDIKLIFKTLLVVIKGDGAY